MLCNSTLERIGAVASCSGSCASLNRKAALIMAKTIDPVFSPQVLERPELELDDLDFDALTQSLEGLTGQVDKNPKTAVIILAGGVKIRLMLPMIRVSLKSLIKMLLVLMRLMYLQSAQRSSS